MTVTAKDLVGAWRLAGWSLVYEDGRPAEYPLGRDAKGFSLYTADGHMSATLMRARRHPFQQGNSAEKSQAYDDCIACAGRYEVNGEVVFHTIEVSTDPALSGIVSTRNVMLDGNRLTLVGPDFSPDAPRYHRIIWRRSERRRA